MKFNEVSKVNLGKIVQNKNNKQKPAKDNSKTKSENIKNSPNNPSYWQSYVGAKSNAISFGANKDTSQQNINEEAKLPENGIETTVQEEKTIDYSKLTYAEKVKLLEDKNIDSRDIDKLAPLEGTRFERALIMADKGADPRDIKFIAELSDEKFEKALKLANKGVDSYTIKRLLLLDETRFKKALELLDKGVCDCIESITMLNGTKYKQALELANRGVNPFRIMEIAILDDASFKQSLETLDKGVKPQYINYFVGLEGKQYEKALKLAEKNVQPEHIKDFVALDETKFERVLELADKGVESNIENIIQLNEKQYEKALKFIDKSVFAKNVVDIVKLDEVQFERALKLADKALSSSEIKELAINETLFEKTLKLIDKGVDSSYLRDIAKLKEEQFDAVLKYIDMGIQDKRALNLAKKGIDLFSQINLQEVPKEEQTAMFKNFFANNPKTDETIRNTDFSQYGKEGIPLKYSRRNFIQDLNQILSNVSEKQKSEILEKLNIQMTNDGNGYDGIIDLTKLSSKGTEGKVLELANKFIKENSVSTGNEELDTALNSLISGMPEFINTIGKQQHGTHPYSLDTHILETYKAAISDSDYDNLSNYQKFELKLMTILHDISKGENVVDENHPLVSAKYAKDILSRYSLPDSTKYEVVNNILNHHWGKDYNTKTVSTEITAVQMGTVSNYNIQKIFAKADLIGMGNSEFSADKLEGLSDSNQERLVNILNKAKETTPLVYTTPIVKPDLIPSKEITLPDGTTKTIRSLNLAELPDDYDMEEFGFLPNTKAKDVTLGVHGANSMSQFDLFEMLTSDPIAASPQSVSIVSKNDNASFKRFGIALNLRAADVINATHYDQGSGTEKNWQKLIKLVTADWEYEYWREILPNKVQEKLGINPSEYSELASIMEDYKYLTQINDSKEITIGEKTFTGKEIKTAISTAQSELMQMTNDICSNITELVVKRAEVMDNTYILRYNSADDVNNENIPSGERKALSAFLSEIPENSTIIFTGYDGYLFSHRANQWKLSRKTSVKE